MENALFCGNREPTLDEILVEPIVRQMIKQDGVQETEILQLLAQANKRPAAPTRGVEAQSRVRPVGYPQASVGVLTHSQSTVRAWPRVFPGL